MKKKCHNNIYTIIKNKTIKNKIKNKYSENNHEKRRKKEKSYLNVVASEAKEREKIRKAY
jgi:hypothetical protein